MKFSVSKEIKVGRMKETNNLTEGKIFKTIVVLSLPIMAQSFIQMAYNMTDMLWLGRVGAGAVASVGTAGFLIWFSFALITIAKIGAEVGVAQSIGKKDNLLARDFARNALQLTIVFGVLYTFAMIAFSEHLIGFFQLGEGKVIQEAIGYLKIVSWGIIFTFVNPVLSGIYNGLGNSKTPFYVNAVGLVINIVLDPVLIFGFKLGVNGAAYATVFSQAVVTTIFIILFRSKRAPFAEFHFFKKPVPNVLKQIFVFGTPIGVQSGLFTLFASLIARIISQWGPVPIAVQKVGSQIEALSWMTAGGFSTALSSFVGQNYGAKQWDRISKGYFITLGLSGFIGIIASILLIFLSETIFAFFIPNDPEALRLGSDYLKILGLSQFFMCLEITSQGAYNGLGRTLTPSLIGITLTGMRIPLAIFLSAATLLGLNGVWWSISMTSVLKGLVLCGLFIRLLIKHPEVSGPKSITQLIFRHEGKAWHDKRGLSGK